MFSHQPDQPNYYFSPEFVANEIRLLQSQIQETTASNVRLKLQLQQQKAYENAYIRIWESGNERTFTLGRYGSPQELMDCVVLSVYRFIPQPPLHEPPFYYIELSKNGGIAIHESDYMNDTRLINAFQQHGITVSPLRSIKRTAMLLRMSVNRHLQQGKLLFYAGWLPNDKNSFDFWAFPDFSTCRHNLQMGFMDKIPAPSAAVTAAAINQFWPVFDIIRSPFLRETVILLYHKAAIHSLLQQLGYPSPLACCFFSTDEGIFFYFRSLLSWFGNSPLSLNLPTVDFSYSLLARKDEPLLIEDYGRLNHAPKNVELLESALLNGVAPWKKGRDILSLPLQAPITLLSSRASALSCAPEVIVLDFISHDFDRTAWLKLADQVSQHQDYLTAFCGYTSDHISELRAALAEGQKSARHLDGGQLTEESLQTLGIFIGLHNFLNSFFVFASLTPAPFPTPAEELFSQLLELLAETSEKADRASLSDQFVEIAHRLIQTGVLHTHRKDRCPLRTESVVFYDDDRLHFTSNAFFTVCHSLAQSRPVILSALADVDLLCGTRINKTTAQTRITVCNAYGISKSISVYSFPRDAFDAFGDPLLLEENSYDED